MKTGIPHLMLECTLQHSNNIIYFNMLTYIKTKCSNKLFRSVTYLPQPLWIQFHQNTPSNWNKLFFIINSKWCSIPVSLPDFQVVLVTSRYFNFSQKRYVIYHFPWQVLAINIILSTTSCLAKKNQCWMVNITNIFFYRLDFKFFPILLKR